MKITIDLSDAEVQGIKDYLKNVGNIEKPNKNDIQTEMQGVVSGYLQSPHSSLTDYIKIYM